MFIRSRSYEIRSRSYEMLSRSIASRNYKIVSRNYMYDIISRNYEIVSRNYGMVSRYYEIASRNYEIASRNYEVVSRNYEIVKHTTWHVLASVGRRLVTCNKYRISNEFSFHTMYYETRCVFYIPSPEARGYKTHNSFHNTSYGMKIHLRFFLSHELTRNEHITR